MRIFLVVWWFDAMGGMERHVTSLACALASAGHDVTVFTEMPLARSNTYGRQLRAAGIPLVTPRKFLPRSANDGAPPALQHVMARGDYNRHTRSLLRSLEDARLTAPPDVVHIHGCRLGQQWIAEWAAACELPAVYTEHTTPGDWGGPHDADAPFAIWASASALACVSEYSKESLRRILPAPRDIRVLRHIIPVPEDVVPEPGTALCVARLASHKGIDVLLHALAILRRQGVAVPLKIAGSGEERPALAQLAASLGLNGQVKFLGQVPPARIASLWAGCAFGVLPSRTEGLPLALLEGMSHGRPVVASNAGGIPEWIRDGVTGLLVPPDDPPALAGALHQLVADPDGARRLGLAARERFATGGWRQDAVVAETLDTYEAARAYRRPCFSAATTQAQARALAAAWSPALHVAYGLAPLGDGEQVLTDLLLAFRWAGADVALVLDSAVPRHNRYARQLRRAGVELHAPSLPASALRAVNALRLLTSACKRRSPAILHLHYWSNANRWPARAAIQAYARQSGLLLAETDHAVATLSPPIPADPHARLAALSDGSPQLHLVRHAAALYEGSRHARG